MKHFISDECNMYYTIENLCNVVKKKEEKKDDELFKISPQDFLKILADAIFV